MTWGSCACGYSASSCADFLRHLDQHAGITRDPAWYQPVHRRTYAQWDDQTAPLVFVRASDGELRYPGRNDAVCPPGHTPMRLRSLQEVNRFERQHGVANEAMHYDRNGRGLDDTIFGEKVTH
jgi:hypothetical protein